MRSKNLKEAMAANKALLNTEVFSRRKMSSGAGKELMKSCRAVGAKIKPVFHINVRMIAVSQDKRRAEEIL